MLVIEFVGYIGNDAEIKNFNGQNYIAFNVATQDKYKDAQGNTVSRTTWVSCLKHEGSTTSTLVQYLKKGTQVFVRGDLSAKTFNSQQGIQVGINCRVRELQLVGGKPENNQQGTQTGTSQQAQGSQPYQGSAPAQPQAPAGAAQAPAQGNGQDDLPF